MTRRTVYSTNQKHAFCHVRWPHGLLSFKLTGLGVLFLCLIRRSTKPKYEARSPYVRLLDFAPSDPDHTIIPSRRRWRFFSPVRPCYVSLCASITTKFMRP